MLVIVPATPVFLSTPSARRATCGVQRALKNRVISIHALREEGDAGVLLLLFAYRISIHALREEGDLRIPSTSIACKSISIHALREEGDDLPVFPQSGQRDFYPRPPRGGRPAWLCPHCWPGLFLSTPSARRATSGSVGGRSAFYISIHALREEGDLLFLFLVDFFIHISIHALREEGDLVSAVESTSHRRFLSTPSARRATQELVECFLRWKFLSTPSARRATAKTETKSLFSNKLYNILHEFRRALIYNGSKSYPNHAK